jgi:hypothetical protein
MMSRNNRDGQPQKTSAVGRRGFVQAALGGAVAGACGATQAGAPGARAGAPAYRETLSTPVVERHQVVVAGGGPSGVIAAVAASRSGADTLLIERYAFLGGTGVASLMTCYNGFRNQHAPEALQTVKGIPAEYVAELVRLGGVADIDNYERQFTHDVTKGDIPYTVGFDPEAAKVAQLNILKREGVKLQLHSWIAAPMLDGTRVTGVIVESKSGRQAIAADIVIDCTGDGDVAAAAGAPFMSPDESGKTDRMPMTLMYRLGGLPAGVKGAFSGIRIKDRVTRWGPAAKGSALDVNNLTQAEIDTRLKLWDSIQEMRKQPGMESLYLLESATQIGVRETRRILGEYVVTTEDAIEGKRFPDVIAISSNPMPGYHGKRYFFAHAGFDIPYRSLVPKKIDGLVLSGRCISSEQGPFQSARSMAPAMAIGHASGCAAALAVKNGVQPRQLDVKALQALLVRQKAELRT